MIINPYRFAGGGGGGGSTLNDGLLHWWDLNEASGNAIAQAGGVDLVDVNTVTSTSSGVPDGGVARTFTRANSEYFKTAAGNVWASGTTMTFAVWIKPISGGDNKSIFYHDAPNGYSHFYLFGTEWPILIYDATQVGFSAVTVNAWTCFLITTTGPGGSDACYRNGTSIFTGSQGWEPGSAEWQLGYGGSGNAFGGDMASCAIWDRVLTADEITEFYNSGVNLRYADIQ